MNNAAESLPLELRHTELEQTQLQQTPEPQKPTLEKTHVGAKQLPAIEEQPFSPERRQPGLHVVTHHEERRRPNPRVEALKKEDEGEVANALLHVRRQLNQGGTTDAELINDRTVTAVSLAEVYQGLRERGLPDETIKTKYPELASFIPAEDPRATYARTVAARDAWQKDNAPLTDAELESGVQAIPEKGSPRARPRTLRAVDAAKRAAAE